MSDGSAVWVAPPCAAPSCSSPSSPSSPYARVPETNQAGAIGTSAAFAHDLHVSSTNDGAGAYPFATIE